MVSGAPSALARLVSCCAAWAGGETLVAVTGPRGYGTLVGLACAAAVYLLIGYFSQGRPGGGGDAKYWRGRRIDGRWN